MCVWVRGVASEQTGLITSEQKQVRNYSPSPVVTTTPLPHRHHPLPLLHPPPTAPLSQPQTFHDTLPPSLSLAHSLAPPPTGLFFCSNVDSRRKLEVFPSSPALRQAIEAIDIFNPNL